MAPCLQPQVTCWLTAACAIETPALPSWTSAQMLVKQGMLLPLQRAQLMMERLVDRGAMGNLMPVAEGEEVPSGMDAVHGVVHRLKPADFAKLTNMEHEYRCRLVWCYMAAADDTCRVSCQMRVGGGQRVELNSARQHACC